MGPLQLHLLPSFLALLSLISAHPLSKPDLQPLPLIIWHGLGDRYDAEGLQSTGTLAQEVHPGTYVYFIRTDDDGNNDRTNTFFGNLTEQMDSVCDALHADAGLREASPSGKQLRVDALGFSQGGQFLRGLVERCEGLSVRSLVTFGSQHNGIAEFQRCGDFDFLCKGATGLVRGNVWTEYVQSRVVPAQYFRTVDEGTGLAGEEYLERSNFLADVNNERERKSQRYKERVVALENFAMYVFEEDQTVIPKESGWFAEVNATSGDITPLRERTMYKEDWLGLKELDEKGGLVFRNTSGKHMELSEKVLRKAYTDFFGPEKSGKNVLEDAVRHSETPIPDRYREDEKRIMRCGSSLAQARWDSMWFWQRWRWNWNHVTKPWLRGDFTLVRGGHGLEPKEQRPITTRW